MVTNIADISPTHRSKITNGRRLLGNHVDGRSAAYRRYKDLFAEFMARSGSVNEILCKQLAGLIIAREALEGRLIQGDAVDPIDHARIAGAINRTMAKLGLLGGDAEKERQRIAQEDREALLP